MADDKKHKKRKTSKKTPLPLDAKLFRLVVGAALLVLLGREFYQDSSFDLVEPVVIHDKVAVSGVSPKSARAPLEQNKDVIKKPRQGSEAAKAANVADASLDKACIKETKAAYKHFMNKHKSALLRRGPHKRFEVVGKLDYGVRVKGELHGKNWVRLDYGRFISRSNLIDLADSGTGEYITRWSAAGRLQALDLPAAHGRVVKTIQRGEKLLFKKVNNEWGRLRGGGFIRMPGLHKSPVYPKTFPAKMMVLKRANIHGGPGAQHSVIGAFFKNRVIEINQLKNGWARVGDRQYVAARHLILVRATEFINSESPKNHKKQKL